MYLKMWSRNQDLAYICCLFVLLANFPRMTSEATFLEIHSHQAYDPGKRVGKMVTYLSNLF